MPARLLSRVAALACLLPCAFAAAAADSAFISPHLQALQPVLQSQVARIKAIDRDSPRGHYTLARACSVAHAADHDFVQTRDPLDTSDRIDGVALARSRVDLANRRASASPVSMASVSSTAVPPGARRP